MDWEDAVVRLVEAYWNDLSKPYPLSRLKPDLRQKGIDLDEKLGGRRLREVVDSDFRNRLEVFKHPVHELVWYMIPVTIEIDAGIASLQDTLPQKKSSNVVLYEKPVFTAFIKALAPGERRFLFFGAKTYFDDKPAGEASPDGGIEVPRDDILLPAGVLLTDGEKAAVSERIQSWQKKSGIQQTQISAVHGSEAKDRSKEFSFDVLDFSGLSASEKARILIPLDVLSKIKLGR